MTKSSPQTKIRLSVGCKVVINRTDIASLKHRPQPVKATVISIYGAHIGVRPTWCKWIAQLYPNEMTVL